MISKNYQFPYKVPRTLCSILLSLLLSFSLFAQHTDPVIQDEHMAALDLTPLSAATHTATSDGNWTNSAIWNTGSVPGAGSRVVIPEGRTVTYNSTSTSNISWIRVEGIFRFATNQNTALNVETIVVFPSGEYEHGSISNPIPANITSVITFVDSGAITDRLKISRGLLTHGKVRIHGAPLTPFRKTNSGLAQGASQATLSSTPSNWKVGDRVAITGMRASGGNPFFSQDEIKTITAISGSTITFDGGLAHERKVDYASFGLYPYLANTSRNIQYKSANTTDHSRKGHVMFMHNPNVDVRWAGFYDLGRTRKDIPVTDAELEASPTGDNPRGKYSLHFHRTGHKDASTQPAHVIGCAVVNSPGWAYVNHDSYVIFEDNVSYNAVGAHYVLENGAERGAFRRNIAIKATGGSRHIKEGTANHDLAHGGEGFWFQGGNVYVTDNVAAGCNNGGFTWFSRSNGEHNMSENQFVPKELLIDPFGTSGREGLSSTDLPIMSSKNNTAYACHNGMIAIDVEINGQGPTNTMIEDFTVLNAFGYAAIDVEYYRNFTFKNVKILRDNNFPWNQWQAAVGIKAFNLVDHIYPLQTRSADRAINLYVRNYGVAVKNFDSSESDDRGEAVRMAKWQVIGEPVDHNSPNGDFNNKGTYNGVPLVTTVASEADIVPIPTYSPTPGTYSTTQTVTINSVPGATIYYVIGGQGWICCPTLEYQLKSGSWTQYTGPITVSENRKIIAVAVRNGQYSRVNNSLFTIDPNATQTVAQPTFSPAAGTYSSAQTVTISTATTGSQIRYTTDESNPTTTHGTLINASSGTVTISNSLTLKAIAYKSGAANSAVTSGTYTIQSAPPPNDIVRELWTNISGTSVSNIPVNTEPTSTSTTSSLEGPTDSGDNYGSRIRAFITPATTGSYTFYIAGDDNSELWLSTNDNASNKARIANVTGWTNSREWGKYTSQQSTARTLNAGTKYYVEVLHKEGSGGDNVAVGWTGPGISSITVISGSVLSPYTAPPTSGFSGTYKLTARHSSKALDVSGGSTADGANVQQWSDNGTAAQQWIITATNDGYYKLKCKASGKVLDVTSSSTANGANVQQWTDNGSGAQQWKIEATTDGFHKLTNRTSGKVLDVSGHSTADGGNVHQWDYVGGNNQQWKLEQLSTSTSSTVAVRGAMSKEQALSEGLQMYPNPVTEGNLNINLSSKASGDGSVTLINSLGARAVRKSVSVVEGENTFMISTAGLAPGLYLVAFVQGETRIVRKIYIK